MRTISLEQLEEFKKHPAYRVIADARRPDHTALRRDAEQFARWIARQHKKERCTAKVATA